MIKEKNIENGVRIFCIFFKNKEKKYDFGKIEGKAEKILQEIVELGQTQQYYNSDSLVQKRKNYFF